jgi:hypothetical protein
LKVLPQTAHAKVCDTPKPRAGLGNGARLDAGASIDRSNLAGATGADGRAIIGASNGPVAVNSMA